MATRYIYMNTFSKKGFIPWEEATIHVLSHVIHYASGVFEGIRGYRTDNGIAIFRGKDHYRRLINSAKIYRMFVDIDEEGFMEITKELIRKNDLQNVLDKVKAEGRMKNPFVYIRPVIFRGFISEESDDPVIQPPLGVNPLKNPTEYFIAVFLWDDYLGEKAIKEGADVITSSWTRIAPNTVPAFAKGVANYSNAQLAKMEAELTVVLTDYKEKLALKKASEKGELADVSNLRFPVESIQLNAEGYVSEGAGENIFVVKYEGKKVKIYTPPIYASILPGITRDSIITIARDLGYEVIETMIPREMLYVADEIFFTGTAAEVTPIRSVDGIPIGKGEPGEVTLRIREEYVGIATGKKEDRYGWLEYV
jgi:branched-chain amino acid aminotransferase